jgi:pyrimidine deaminase RibD-like protein
MTEDDLKHRQAAIELAKRCTPAADRIPKVGAVIAIGPAVIGRGYRGSGHQDDDDHAEKKALLEVRERSQLSMAAVYTTLEPCTPGVRSDPLNCCTNLLKEAGIKRVFIGILDPNQGVTGKGLWELQDHGIEVELFPPDLAGQIRALNSEFIRSQKTLGLVITNPKNGQMVNGGDYVLEGTYSNPPGEDVFALTSVGPRWWVQPHPLSSTADGKSSVKVYFGSSQDHNVTISPSK